MFATRPKHSNFNQKVTIRLYCYYSVLGGWFLKISSKNKNNEDRKLRTPG